MSARRWWCRSHGTPPSVATRGRRRFCGACFAPLVMVAPLSTSPAAAEQVAQARAGVATLRAWKRDNG